jgi:hypothetical protein
MLPPSQPINRTKQPITEPIHPRVDRERLNAKYGVPVSPSRRIIPRKRSDLEDVNFWNEVRAYANISNLARERYAGLYVAVYNGDIVDSDPDEAVLAERFYRTFGYVPVLIHAVGVEDGVIDQLD